MKTVYRLVWDGEPKMGGGHHLMSMSNEFMTLADAKYAKEILEGFKTNKPGLRIQKRNVSMWESVDD